MPFRAVQVVPQALKVAEQQPLAKSYETELPDDPLLNLQHVHAFLEFTAARVAFNLFDLHCHGKRKWLKNVELIYLPTLGRKGAESALLIASRRHVLASGSHEVGVGRLGYTICRTFKNWRKHIAILIDLTIQPKSAFMPRARREFHGRGTQLSKRPASRFLRRELPRT